MIKLGKNVAIFYNPDCAKYGIKRRCKCHAYGEHWPQITAPNGGIYTKYKKVAKRWAYDYIKQYGDKMTNY